MTEKIIEPKSVAVEASLLNAMMSRQHYNQYASYIDYKRVLSPTALLLNDYKKYYELYPEHENINRELFYTQFCQTWHRSDLTQQDVEYFRDYVLPAIYSVESKDVDSCLLGFIEKQTTEDLINNTAKSFNLDKLRGILDSFEKRRSEIVKDLDPEAVTIDNVDFDSLNKDYGIPWFLPTLQDSLGSLIKGEFIVVSADSNTGKSAFSISQIIPTLKFFKARGYGKVLYFNSEGTTADVIGRICSNLFRDIIKEGFEYIIKNYDEVYKLYNDEFPGERTLVTYQIFGHSLEWITSRIMRHKPDLVVIDIADSLAKTGDTETLKRLFDQLRMLSGAYCPIIATTQAGDQSYIDKETGEKVNRRWLDDKATYNSKGKGCAANTQITIGKDSGNSNLRYISIPKKKRGKSVDITCQLIEEYSLYEELSW